MQEVKQNKFADGRHRRREGHDVLFIFDSPYGSIALDKDSLDSSLELGALTRRRFSKSEGVLVTAPSEPLLDANAAAEVLSLKPTWLLQQARERRLPHYRFGKYIRFDPNQLREAMEVKPW